MPRSAYAPTPRRRLLSASLALMMLAAPTWPWHGVLAAPTPAATSASAAAAPAQPAEAPPALPTATSTQVLTLRQMGSYGPIALRGVDDDRSLDVGVRLDEVVTAARLKLVFTYSPALIFPLSHIKITLNDEVIATVPLEEKEAGRLVTREIDLDPRFFTDFNHLTVQLIAHYTMDHCEDPLHSSLWADISPATTLTLSKAHMTLPDSLALLPAPFFDRRDNRRVTVPFVLPANADAATLRAAGLVASWLGALASYREARFPVARSAPADADSIAFVLPGDLPAGIALPEIKGPSVSVMPNPASPHRKLLVIAGRTPQELQTAANGVVLSKTAMAGSSSQVQSVDIGSPRQPYDAPAWAPTDRPILFKELVSDPQQLQVAGYNPNPIRVNLRVPADLYDWTRSNVPLNVRYRYTAPPTYNDSVISIDINDQLVRSYRLKPLAMKDDQNLVSVPLLSGSSVSAENLIGIPAFRVGSNNQMQVSFHIDSQKTGLCTSTATNVARAAIDPDSSIDFSRFSHYTGLPNLAFFANSGYPFTRLADLADTAVVMPDAPTALDQEALLTLLGHMGKWTGLPSLRVAVVPAAQIDSVRGRNLLIVGTGSAAGVLGKWGKSLPMLIERGRTEITLRDQRSHAWSNWLSGVEEDPITPTGRAILTADGPLAALVGFQSPYAEGNSVVALTATEDGRVADLLDSLENPGKVAQMRGDLTVVRHDQVDGLRLGERYYVGDLPWYARVWIRVSAFPSLMAIAGLLAGLVVALSLFWTLGKLAARRNGG
ncbi:cellulose biosynthesis cyclic di-GMP-binding regulatory protein BcsB [Cupriavidus numazuensis]|uniref:Cyclic di-GMP-binding protein n=1 Tax=Cupriavidus numazuensis TaxID=221992 RepID=A0ABN7Q629_9BURK|nr:cellulose biosynthesis cyclic di-GMP-binding regulatory protein BcsB [Cupriavidus numazuensis]CAG2155698.1 Cyclic di-GMP-binding protein [Cupriavidus numazuensis]